MPLAVRLPKMSEGSLVTTRLSATALLLGCANCTDAPEPMLKLFQLTTRSCVVCVTFMAAPLVVMAAAPLVTLPPCGNAVALSDCA